jgi:hypothetical protein
MPKRLPKPSVDRPCALFLSRPTTNSICSAAPGARALGHSAYGGGQPDPGLLLERGITLRQGRQHLEAALPGILEDATAKLSGALRMLISQLKHELEELASVIAEADGSMGRTSR